MFVLGVEEGLLPHARSLFGDGGDDGLVDELRVAYVAVTRARERLYLSYCAQRMRGDRVVPRHASRFFRGLPPDVLAPLERAA